MGFCFSGMNPNFYSFNFFGIYLYAFFSIVFWYPPLCQHKHFIALNGSFRIFSGFEILVWTKPRYRLHRLTLVLGQGHLRHAPKGASRRARRTDGVLF
jgi:hypothetical protein